MLNCTSILNDGRASKLDRLSSSIMQTFIKKQFNKFIEPLAKFLLTGCLNHYGAVIDLYSSPDNRRAIDIKTSLNRVVEASAPIGFYHE